MQKMAEYVNISKQTMKEIIDELDVDGDGTISLREWSDYITDIQHNMNDKLKNTKRKKSILQGVVELRMIEDKEINLDDQVKEWMRLQDDNKNI